METVEEKERFSLLPLRPKDVGDVSRLLCSMDPWLTMEYKPESFEYYFLRADPALSRLVVMYSDNIAGVLSLRFPWLFGPFIELMALFDGYRHKGIGSRIVDWACCRHRSSNLWATVSSFNLKAQRFYSRVGFEKMVVLEDLIKPGWNEILLRKKLNSESCSVPAKNLAQ